MQGTARGIDKAIILDLLAWRTERVTEKQKCVLLWDICDNDHKAPIFEDRLGILLIMWYIYKMIPMIMLLEHLLPPRQAYSLFMSRDQSANQPAVADLKSWFKSRKQSDIENWTNKSCVRSSSQFIPFSSRSMVEKCGECLQSHHSNMWAAVYHYQHQQDKQIKGEAYQTGKDLFLTVPGRVVQDSLPRVGFRHGKDAGARIHVTAASRCVRHQAFCPKIPPNYWGGKKGTIIGPTVGRPKYHWAMDESDWVLCEEQCSGVRCNIELQLVEMLYCNPKVCKTCRLRFVWKGKIEGAGIEPGFRG